MKKLNFKVILSLIICTLYFDSKKAQNKILPSHVKTQFAGSIGLFSASLGYQYANGWTETDLYVGYLPASHGFDKPVNFTLKQTIYPWKNQFLDQWELKPLITGLFITMMPGKQYLTISPDHYEKNYYWWSHRYRLHLFWGTEIAYTIPPSRQSLIDQIGFYLEFNTNDLYAISKFLNPTLPITNIVKTGLGLRFLFRYD